MPRCCACVMDSGRSQIATRPLRILGLEFRWPTSSLRPDRNYIPRIPEQQEQRGVVCPRPKMCRIATCQAALQDPVDSGRMGTLQIPGRSRVGFRKEAVHVARPSTKQGRKSRDANMQALKQIIDAQNGARAHCPTLRLLEGQWLLADSIAAYCGTADWSFAGQQVP